LFAVALVAGEAHGGEFGNVLGTPLVDERSRQASAQALEGIIKVLNAIRLRELRNPDQGAKELSEAVAVLGRAHEMMKAVRLPPDLDKSFDLKGLPQPYQGIVENAVRRMGRQNPTKLSELYSLLVDATESLRVSIEKQVGGGPQPIFPALRPEISVYFALADAVSHVSRSL
jgi:hypothetical protein